MAIIESDRPLIEIYDRAGAAMWLGILALVLNVLLIPGILAFYFGRKTKKAWDKAWSAGYLPVNQMRLPVSRGKAIAGITMGIIGTIAAIILGMTIAVS